MLAATIPQLFQDTKREWLIGARITAKRLLKTKPRITIEDVLAVYPLPKYLHRNTIGNVFRDRDFQSVGFTKSRRAVSRGRWIMYWTLSYDDVVEQDCV